MPWYMNPLARVLDAGTATDEMNQVAYPAGLIPREVLTDLMEFEPSREGDAWPGISTAP